MWTIFKVFIDFITKLILFSGWLVLFFLAGGMWDLRSPTRDQTCALGTGRHSLNHFRQGSSCSHGGDARRVLVSTGRGIQNHHSWRKHRMSSHTPLAHFHPHFIHHLVLRVFLSNVVLHHNIDFTASSPGDACLQEACATHTLPPQVSAQPHTCRNPTQQSHIALHPKLRGPF